MLAAFAVALDRSDLGVIEFAVVVRIEVFQLRIFGESSAEGIRLCARVDDPVSIGIEALEDAVGGKIPFLALFTCFVPGLSGKGKGEAKKERESDGVEFFIWWNELSQH